MTLQSLNPGPFADTLVTSAAHAVTRRRFLRTTGTAALGVALGAGFLTKADKAWATGTCYSLGNGPCGPSPLCSGNCNGAGECGSFYRRKYATYTCDTSGTVGNCWSEYCNCGTSWPGQWSCCDCCGPGGGGSSCGCGTACICRSIVGSC